MAVIELEQLTLTGREVGVSACSTPQAQEDLGKMTQTFASWLTNIKADDIDGGLAADFDGSLSGLGVELGSAPYNMR